jgi:hypothetical protein
LDLSHEGLKLAQVPLIHQLLKEDIYLGLIARTSSRQIEKANHSQQTVVTPEVHALSVVMFQQSFKMVRPYKQRVLNSYKHPLNLGEIHGASPIIKWIGDSSLHPIYTAVKIGKTIYKVGFTVFYVKLCAYQISPKKLLLCFLEKTPTR